MEEDVGTVRESLSTVQEGVTGQFPDASRRRAPEERPSDDAAAVKAAQSKRPRCAETYPVLEQLTRRERESMSSATGGGDDEARPEKQPPLQSGSRYAVLKKAAIEHYQTGISLKNAAKKHGVGVRELKEFYENEAGEFLQKKNFASSDESEDDP